MDYAREKPWHQQLQQQKILKQKCQPKRDRTLHDASQIPRKGEKVEEQTIVQKKGFLEPDLINRVNSNAFIPDGVVNN